jgi:hypothetical protein
LVIFAGFPVFRLWLAVVFVVVTLRSPILSLGSVVVALRSPILCLLGSDLFPDAENAC